MFFLALMQAVKSSAKHEYSSEISLVAVDPPYQGMGFGSMMLSYADKWSNDNGFLFVQTQTANQSLQEFY